MAVSDLAIAVPLAVSNLAIAGISAGAALLGALVGGWVTYRIEQSRQEHERKLERERHEHERELELERYDQQQAARKEQDLDVARGLARVMMHDFMLAASKLDAEREGGRWVEGTVWKPRLGAEDRRDLFRYLRSSEFMAIVQAEMVLEEVEHLRQHVHAEHEGKGPPPSTFTTHQYALDRAREAHNALVRLSIAGQEFESD